MTVGGNLHDKDRTDRTIRRLLSHNVVLPLQTLSLLQVGNTPAIRLLLLHREIMKHFAISQQKVYYIAVMSDEAMLPFNN